MITNQYQSKYTKLLDHTIIISSKNQTPLDINETAKKIFLLICKETPDEKTQEEEIMKLSERITVWKTKPHLFLKDYKGVEFFEDQKEYLAAVKEQSKNLSIENKITIIKNLSNIKKTNK
jgi:hypothetical protein